MHLGLSVRPASSAGRSAGLFFCAFLIVRCRANSAGELYCGRDDCYALLGVTHAAESSDIKKAYRRLALKWHPDKNKDPAAPEMFRKISRAHEVLSEDKLRRAYDYYLEHPEESYMHYYQYYNAMYAPKTPLWAVCGGVLSFLSVLQYINQNWKYKSMMRAVQYQPKFKRRVNELVETEVASYKGKLSKVDKEVLRERIEQRVLDSEVQVTGGGFSKPSLRGLIGVKALLLPLSTATGLYDCAHWHWRFNVRKEEYGPEERAYLTRRALGLSEDAWASLEDAEQHDFVARELWHQEHLQAYITHKEEQMKEKLAQSGAYKRARRWVRNH